MKEKIKAFIKKETVLCIAALCAAATMFLIPPDGEYLHYIDWRVLCLLLCLMAVVAGFKNVGAFQWLTCQLLSRIKNGRVLSLTLVLLPFFCSMLVTNDVALLVFVPFTLGLLSQLGCANAVIPILVLQTIAANLGSMATPVGNPQNLYLYAAYELGIADFFGVVLPLTAVSLVCLSAASLPVLPKALPKQKLEDARICSFKELLLYAGLFLLCLLTVFRVIPYPITTVIVVAVLLLVNRKLLGSMLVTNDVALLVFVPFTLGLLSQLGCANAVIPILVLQTIAANLGSMATPVGNPQNLYLYAAYELGIADFFGVVLPLTAVSLVCLSAASLPVLPKALPKQKLEDARICSFKELLLYAGLFLLCLLTVFRVIPYPITTVIVVAVLLLVNRKLLGQIDYMLLLTFVCFFVVSENLGRMDAVREFLQSLLGRNTLLTAVGASQVISNVPAAVLLSGFTDQWADLLAGVNIGGLGTPIASLASLITLKLYIPSPGARVGRFLAVFTLANIMGLIVLLTFTLVF